MTAVGAVALPGVLMERQRLFPPYLNAGPTGAAVTALQLILTGMFPGQQFVTGEYDEQTIINVLSLQTRLGFEGKDLDGNFGPGTRRRLREKMDIDVDAIEAEAIPGTTHYKSPEGDGVWPAADAA